MQRGKRLIVALLTGLSMTAAGAEYEIRWLEKNYDFGLMKEVAGPKSGRSRFVNTGKKPVTITYARPSCGCTSVDYPEEPIMPGDTATICYTYDPTGRPGRFEKSVKVTLDDSRKEIIRISGNVLGTPESLSMFYPIEVGHLRLTDGGIDAGTVTMGSAPNKFVNGYNQSPDTIRPRVTSGSPGLKITTNAEAVGPGDIVTYGLYFDTRAHGETGPVEIPVVFSLDERRERGEKGERGERGESAESGEGSASYTLIYRAEVLPAPTAAINRGKTGECFIAPGNIDLGSIPSGGNGVDFTFRILNQGRGQLDVTRIYGDREGFRLVKGPEKIKGGKSAEVICRLETGLMGKGPFRMKVKVLTNDPMKPVNEISVSGEIE
ncbi:MAG: DUF1573 domain-containing protein [Bacteroidales bacterium]|nr:DUF1573 domain-containing protein [Bacteroidales bacterium]